MMGTVVTLATIPAVLALTNLAKQFGVRGKWAALLAATLGILITVAEYLVATAGHGSAQGVYMAVAAGVILGLSAAGLYDMTSPADPPRRALIEPVLAAQVVPLEGTPPAELVPAAEHVTARDVDRLNDWHDQHNGGSTR